MQEAKRREFLKVLGVGTAAGLTGCTTTAPDALTPYVTPPEEAVKGHALWYASTCRECPAGCGVLARVREGRVHKVEGNPVHPVNAGGLCARGQAAVQGLYNPDRVRTPLARDKAGALVPVSWVDAEKRLAAGLRRAADGGGVALVSSLAAGAFDELAEAWVKALGSQRYLRFEPIAYESVREANRLTFGIAGLPVLRFAEANAIYLFGTDAIETFVSPVGYARGIADARRAGGRLVYFGSRLSLTGARADQWVETAAGGEGAVAMAIAREILAKNIGATLAPADRKRFVDWCASFTPERAGVGASVIEALAREFTSKPSLAVAGGVASCDERALATALAVNLLNVVAGNANRTVRFDHASALDRVATRSGMDALCREMESGAIKALVVVDSNPAYACQGFTRAVKKVPFVACLASHLDETAETTQVVLPIPTPLEDWGDFEPWTGVHSLQQPAMRPVFETRSAGDILLRSAASIGRSWSETTGYYDFLRSRWRRLHAQSGSKEDFEAFWSSALQRGGWWEDVPERRLSWGSEDAASKLASLAPSAKREGYRLETYPSLARFDGRGANKPWLQELPDPITQTVWDSHLEMNPADAASMNLRTGDLVQVKSTHGEVRLPVYLYPGIRRGAVAAPLGQGHSSYGRYAKETGVNVAALLDPRPDPSTGGTRWSGTAVRIVPVRRGQDLVVIAGHDLQEHREIARSRIVSASGTEKPGHGEAREEISLYKPHEHKTHHWGMVVDLDACNGCSACVTACYAENNIPAVGKEEAGRGREMSWIRVERFFGRSNRVNEPFEIDFIMMLCQQCDHAPCEPVCPVFAAYHNAEGLNGQVYNRCVGTRYCANNCPYKVRRFNWYPGEFPAPLDWQLNPDVTVRSKGVMEKCTFCVQRITEGKDRARREGRALKDGEIIPACAQSCPTQAITFGDLNDSRSRVSQLAKNERRYRVLEELNTRPAVTYLERERRRV